MPSFRTYPNSTYVRLAIGSTAHLFDGNQTWNQPTLTAACGATVRNTAVRPAIALPDCPACIDAENEADR